MAVTKLWKVTDNLDRVIDYAEDEEKTRKPKYSEKEWQSLKDVLKYAKDEEKTEQQFYVSGINCNPDKAREQFVMVKEQYNKTDGIQAYHGYISFKDTDNISPDLAQQIGIEFVNRVWGERFQVVVTTHLNTKCLHCHYVVNSVSLVDGKRLQNREKAWFYFRHIADEVCREYGLSVIENPDRNKEPDYVTLLDSQQTMKEQAGIPTRYNLARAAIDEAVENSRTLEEFKRCLSAMGYKYKISPTLKYWTVTPKGWDKPIRLYRLGENYTNVRIQERIKENDIFMSINMKSYQPAIYVPNEKYNPRKVKGSLYNLYLYYCYRLGYFNKPNEKQNIRDYNRLHYLLREDLMKVDKYSQEAELLGKNHIDTTEQLFSYKESLQKELETLTDDRKHLRNKERRNISEVESAKVKSEISRISQRLKELRREISLCDDIAAHSHILENNVEQIIADDERLNRKSKYISKEENRNV
ncbi:MAG: relaxase/mobilization nuclease domain-containing protein [Acetobacter sp.]|nr:relaxase/mobilization nuclease domain-containing protein [Bacteroides sp.]MCM1341866.1 relaxase/mobilization nuclease domain-containing protein [Acetobacter sp.]MCM1433163.1 relaxase/mobilization nuclease domain-containing protein [Clostridiales bacterium]